MSELQDRCIAAIRAGKATSAQALADEIGTDRKTANNVLSGLRRSGAVGYEMKHARAIDWTTVRVLGDEGTKARAPKMKKPKADVVTYPLSAVTEPEPDLAEAITVTFTREEIAHLEGLHAHLGALVETLKASPPLGREGAFLVGLVAKLHAKGA